MKLWVYKFRNWEYWPAYIVYLPTFFLWIWYVLKFRSFSFFKYANPAIKNGGLYGDSKYEIYNLLPNALFPKTILVDKKKEIDLLKIIAENQIDFPVYAKPDIGLRGIDVKKISSNIDLLDYCKNIQKNFLIQESIAYPNEIGLFYCRMPNENSGKITGITLKKFLTIEGNGKDNIEELLKKEPRFKMQIPKLKETINLSEILINGEKRCLVPYGNHNRGTAFFDGNNLITKKLEKTFDEILKPIEGFYFGRLDIRYNTFEELEQGINFSIIELNGAKSEPTHIYDPKHSFWFGQREIFKHQRLMAKIIASNK